MFGVYNAPSIQYSRRVGVDIRSAFDMYDLSKTGFVTRRDFREAMRKLQVKSKNTTTFLTTFSRQQSSATRVNLPWKCTTTGLHPVAHFRRRSSKRPFTSPVPAAHSRDISI